MKIIFCIGKYEFIIRFLGKINKIFKNSLQIINIKNIIKF